MSGFVYEGQYFNGKRQGKGRLSSEDRVYEGYADRRMTASMVRTDEQVADVHTRAQRLFEWQAAWVWHPQVHKRQFVHG